MIYVQNRSILKVSDVATLLSHHVTNIAHTALDMA